MIVIKLQDGPAMRRALAYLVEEARNELKDALRGNRPTLEAAAFADFARAVEQALLVFPGVEAEDVAKAIASAAEEILLGSEAWCESVEARLHALESHTHDHDGLK